MDSKWFNETFLPSIFEKVGAGKQKWLTARQTMICTDNMQKSTVRYDADGYGTMHNHDNYSCKWNGRDVHLSYSKKNGCGCIEFGYNAEEIEAMRIANDAEKARVKADRIERTKKNPERLAKKIEDLKRKIKGWMEEYELDIADGDEEQAKYDLQAIEELKAELALYVA